MIHCIIKSLLLIHLQYFIVQYKYIPMYSSNMHLNSTNRNAPHTYKYFKTLKKLFFKEALVIVLYFSKTSKHEKKIKIFKKLHNLCRVTINNFRVLIKKFLFPAGMANNSAVSVNAYHNN